MWQPRHKTLRPYDFEAIFREAGGRCQIVGCRPGRAGSGHLVVHHLDREPSNNARGNLLVVCEACHRDIHAWLHYHGHKGYHQLGGLGVRVIFKTGHRKYHRKGWWRRRRWVGEQYRAYVRPQRF